MTAYASKSGRLENLLSLKGLACVLVVAYHVVAIDPRRNTAPDYLRLWQFCAVLAHLRMPLFAFLGGYIFSIRPVVLGTYQRFMRRKLVRLYVPAVTAGALYIVLSGLAKGGGGQIEYMNILRSLVYSTGPYWFVQAMVVIFFAVSLAEICGFLSTLRRFVMVLMVAIALNIYGNAGIVLFSLDGAVYLLPFFIMGMGMHRYSSLIRWKGWFPSVVAFVFGLTFVVQVAGIFGFHGAPIERNTLMALLLSTSSLLIAFHLVPPVKALDFVGRYSFTIYLFHFLFIGAMQRFGRVAGMEEDYAWFIATLIVGGSGPILVEKIARRLPDTLQLCLIGSDGGRIGAAAR